MNLDFGKYYEAPEPGRRERAHAWATAIGLQDVDGLKPSQYLIEMAKEHIEGRITIDEVIKRIDEYYDKRNVGQEYGTSDSEAVKGLQRHDVVVNDVINRRDVGVNNPNVGINVGINHSDDVINDVINDVIKFTRSEGIAVKALIRNPTLSAAKLADLIGVKQRQAQRIIASLKKKAGLKRRGARKNGEWYFETGANQRKMDAAQIRRIKAAAFSPS